MKKFLVLFGILGLLAACGKMAVLKYAGPGEYANYKRASGGRTSAVISEASGYAKVNGETETGVQISIDYRVKALGSVYEDSMVFEAPHAFFTTKFKEELRRDGFKQTPDFKIVHKGFDGTCDDVQITDIQADTSPLSDVIIDSHICPDVPVIGAKTLDMKATTRGQRIKLGLNYYVP